MQLKTFSPTDVTRRRVLVRVDYNVPIKNGIVGDDTRIQASLPTIQHLLKNQAQVILMSHLGRPDGKVDPQFSLKPIADHLQQLLNQPVALVEQYWPVNSGMTLPNAPIVLLENLRFHPEEEANDPTFAQHLASLGDVYINEAFSTAHRAHASTEGVTKFLPSFAGLALTEEVSHLQQLMTNPKRPFVMVIGGAKISDKVDAVVNLTEIADCVLIGGGVANNFLKAEGINIAHSYVQDAPVDAGKKGMDFVKVAADLLESTERDKVLLDGYIPLPKLIPPIDVLAGDSLEATTSHTVELIDESVDVQSTDMYLDIGPKTIRLFKDLIAQAGTIFWNGPMGVWENEVFAQGTKEIAQAIADSPAYSVLGGGDTIAAIQHFNLVDKYKYVSTAGGASLEFLSGKTLPSIKPLLIDNPHDSHH